MNKYVYGQFANMLLQLIPETLMTYENIQRELMVHGISGLAQRNNIILAAEFIETVELLSKLEKGGVEFEPE